MEFKINVTSIETIKPSSPTPKSLQKYELSFLDQSMSNGYIPFVYFYQSKPDRLKVTLSETLSRFYPLAGRLVGNHYVDCNDAGIPFVEAEANCRLSAVVADRDYKNLHVFHPYGIEEVKSSLMAVQATCFSCGGLALGLLVSHKVADAFSFVFFVNTWSAISRGGGGGVPLPKLEAAAFFPPRMDAAGIDPASYATGESLVSGLFSFPAAAISRLRESYSGGGERPSRVEALSCFMWTQLQPTFDPKKNYAMFHMVNLRGRAEPRLSKHHFGNMVGFYLAVPAAGDGGVGIVRTMRAAMKGMDKGHVISYDSMDGNEKKVGLRFSSVCGLPFYEADFGSGRPVWVQMTHFPFKNMVIFMDAESGGGIEAVIFLTKQDMDKFEANMKMQLQLLKSNL